VILKEKSVRKSKYSFFLPIDKYRLKVRKSNKDSYFFVREIFNTEIGTVNVRVEE